MNRIWQATVRRITKLFFSYVKQNSKCAETISTLKGENNIWVKDDIDKANVLNRYFKSVFVRDDNSNPSIDYTCETELDISEDLITEDIVLEKLDALKKLTRVRRFQSKIAF